MNLNYVYWSIDSTNWDNIYDKYKFKFSSLNIQDSTDVVKAIDYFREITNRLIDGHFNISINNNLLGNTNIYPSSDRKQKKLEYHPPFSYNNIIKTYLDSGYLSGDYVTTNPQQPNLFLMSGTINSKVLYLSCNYFYLYRAYTSVDQNGAKSVLQFFFDHLQTIPFQIKSVIIDVRNNPGGDLSDLNLLVGHLIDKPLHFGFTRYKSGTGRLDYTPWIDAYVNPQDSSKQSMVPIIVLADNFSASLSETVTMAIHTLPTGVFIGENTWGATGPFTDNKIYNDGPFEVGDFMSVQTSSAMFKYLDNKIYEGLGFPPDVLVPFNQAAIDVGRDLQIEKALEIILK